MIVQPEEAIGWNPIPLEGQKPYPSRLWTALFPDVLRKPDADPGRSEVFMPTSVFPIS